MIDIDLYINSISMLSTVHTVIFLFLVLLFVDVYLNLKRKRN